MFKSTEVIPLDSKSCPGLRLDLNRFNNDPYYKFLIVISLHQIIILLLLLIVLLNHDQTVWAQQLSFSQDSFENTTNNQTQNRLDTIIQLLEQAKQGSIIQLNLTIIVFMMGLAYVIFGLDIGQEQKLSVFTKRLYLTAYFALIIPITVILVKYIVNAMSSGVLDDPVLTVAFLLLIPVTASYVLMIVKSRHEFVQRS